MKNIEDMAKVLYPDMAGEEETTVMTDAEHQEWLNSLSEGERDFYQWINQVTGD